MKTGFTIIGLILFIACSVSAQAQEPAPATVERSLTDDCQQLLSQRLDFLIDGSFQDASALVREITRLKVCGLDDFDVKFFGRMESMSSMLRKMTKERQLEQLTFKDLYLEMDQMKSTQGYQEIKKITLLSEELATRKGSLQHWDIDIQLFRELGASRTVIASVYEYLEAHPDNTLTYQEILESLKK
jgi:hypothetical protein